MFDLKIKKNRRLQKFRASSLNGLVKKITLLFRTYKGKDYKATLTPEGKIKLAGKVFTSPSAAGSSIVKHGCNGWRFWYLKDADGNIISLDELRST